MADPRYQRATRTLWRAAPDRVVVRLVGHDGLDLVGATALVWIALDEPRTIAALAADLAEFGGADTTSSAIEGVVRELESRGLVAEVPA